MNEKIRLALIGFSLGGSITSLKEETILRHGARLIDFEDKAGTFATCVYSGIIRKL
jgi:hypothetical protein